MFASVVQIRVRRDEQPGVRDHGLYFGAVFERPVSFHAFIPTGSLRKVAEVLLEFLISKGGGKTPE